MGLPDEKKYLQLVVLTGSCCETCAGSSCFPWITAETENGKYGSFFEEMYFSLLDRIESLIPNEHIIATKSLSMSEEYLRDHFPNFPVMPGVLMLEALTQASAWLIRVSGNFSHSVVLLKEARGVRYGKFVQPGQTLRIESSLIKQEGDLTYVKAEGSLEGKNTLKAQLVLERSRITDRFPARSGFDEKLILHLKNELALIWPDFQEKSFSEQNQ